MNLGVSFKSALFLRDMTQQDLATEMGVSRQYVSMLAAGKKPLTLEKLAGICAILNLEMSHFISLGEDYH